MVIAMMTLPTLPRVSAISAIASRIGGIDISPSITRMMNAVGPAHHAGDEPDREAGERGKDRHREADRERDARAVDDARIDVAAEHVGAEPVLRRTARACARRVSSVVGSTVPRYGANTAISTMTISSAPPIATVGWRRRKPVMPRRGLTGGQQVRQRRRGGDLSAGTASAGGGLNSGSSDRSACRAGRQPD